LREPRRAGHREYAVEYRLLGPVEVWSGEEQVSVGGPTSRAILAVLALSAGRVVSVDRLTSAAWGDDLPATVSAQLHNRISGLRRSLSRHGDAIVRRADGYVLDVAVDRVDALVFERLAGRARSETGDAEWRADLFGRALGMWRGPALEGLARTAVVVAEAARLDELRMGVVEQRIEVELAAGRHAEVVGELAALVAEYPLRERLRALLMVALYRSGRQAEAPATYQAGRRLLVEELGVEPGPELRRVESAVLSRDPELEAAPVVSSAAVDVPVDSGRDGARPSPESSGRRRRWAVMWVGIGVVVGVVLGAPVSTLVWHAVAGRPQKKAAEGPHFSLTLFTRGSAGPSAFWTDDQRCGTADEYRLTYDLPVGGKGRAVGYRLTHADCGVKLFDGSGGSGYGEPLLADGRFHALDPHISGHVSSVVAYSCCNGKIIKATPGH
jgi:DNA-binding SARP family transcriptional activator